jgi:hypothetical protein
MNETTKTHRAVWRRLRAGWPRPTAAPSERFVQSVMDRVRREPLPKTLGERLSIRDLLFSGGARWSLAAAGALALAFFSLRPPAATPTLAAAVLNVEQTLPWEEESSAGYGTDVEEYLL